MDSNSELKKLRKRVKELRRQTAINGTITLVVLVGFIFLASTLVDKGIISWKDLLTDA